MRSATVEVVRGEKDSLALQKRICTKRERKSELDFLERPSRLDAKAARSERPFGPPEKMGANKGRKSAGKMPVPGSRKGVRVLEFLGPGAGAEKGGANTRGRRIAGPRGRKVRRTAGREGDQNGLLGEKRRKGQLEETKALPSATRSLCLFLGKGEKISLGCSHGEEYFDRER